MAITETDPSTTDPNLGAQIVADAKEHVLYSWSVQNAINPIPVAGRRGPPLLGLRRQALPRLRLAARQRQHRPPAPEDHPGDQGSGRQALHDRAADGERVALAARPDAGRGDPGRSLRLVLHERRRRGERERDQARTHGHGAPQDHRALPLLPRRHPRGRLAHRRPAPLARGARHGRHRARLRPVHLPLPRRASRSVPRVHRRAAPGGDPRTTRAPTRSPRSSSRPSPARTASSSRRTATSRACARCATATASC